MGVLSTVRIFVQQSNVLYNLLCFHDTYTVKHINGHIISKYTLYVS
jgi:hypothetical protein